MSLEAALEGRGADPAGYLVVGTVRRPHGLRGEVLVAVETDRPEIVFRSGRVLYLGDSDGRLEGGTLTVRRVKPMNDGMILDFAELSERNSVVEGLRGRSLMIPETEASPAGPDEVHYRDIRGMRVFTDAGEVGTVSGLLETPGGELLVVRRPGRSDALVPLVKEMVRSIDREARRIEITPPEGLLDL